MTRDVPASEDAAGWSVDELGVVVTGLVLVAVASLPWYVARLGPGEDVTQRAWDLGPLGLLPVLLAVYAAGRTAWVHYRPLGADVPLAPGVEPLAAAFVAFLLMTYRSLDVPSVPLASRVDKTVWLIVALSVAVLQLVFAGRSVARTGIRA